VLLFLGSGVSFDSGMPGVEILTDLVIGSNTDLYRAAVAIDENSRANSDLSKVQDLFRLLRDLDEGYMEKIAPYKTKDGYDKTGSIARKRANYENIFYYVEQILACGQGLSDNASSASFIDTIVRQAGSWLKSEESRNAEPEDLDAALNVNLYRIARQAKGFIEWTVAEALGPTDPKKMDYIVDFAQAARIVFESRVRTAARQRATKRTGGGAATPVRYRGVPGNTRNAHHEIVPADPRRTIA